MIAAAARQPIAFGIALLMTEACAIAGLVNQSPAHIFLAGLMVGVILMGLADMAGRETV